MEGKRETDQSKHELRLENPYLLFNSNHHKNAKIKFKVSILFLTSWRNELNYLNLIENAGEYSIKCTIMSAIVFETIKTEQMEFILQRQIWNFIAYFDGTKKKLFTKLSSARPHVLIHYAGFQLTKKIN